MYSTTSLLLSFCFFFLLILPTSATSSVAYPVSDQYPLIARVGQAYSWSISPETFATSDSDNSTISASSLPPWLSFSNSTFYGTPSASDEGPINVTLEAGGARDSFTLCVTHFPPPRANIALADQFNTSNPSMSSVFPISTGSALRDDKPALRVPLRWSFSIGFQPDTFVNDLDLFYYAQLANGSRLPDWLSFDNRTATFDGVARTPPLRDGEKVELVLIASDQEGYSAYRAPFDLLVASHDVSLSRSLVFNVTADQEFKIDIREQSWFFNGVSVDNTAFLADNITSLILDTSSANWVNYDDESFTLSGMAPSSGIFSLPMSLLAFNESLSMNTTVAIVPSYFNAAVLPGAFANPGTDASISLARYFSLDKYFADHDVSLSASSSTPFLNLTMQGSEYLLTGHIPEQPDVSHIDVQLSAFDHVTHATSHATLRVSLRMPSSDVTAKEALAKHRRLVLGLSIGLGGTAGLILLAGILALLRRFCRAEDTARGPYSPDEKVGELPVPDLEEGGYGWSEKAGLGLSDLELLKRPNYKDGGIGYTPSILPGSPPPKRTTKGVFFRNVRAAVKNFSSSNGNGSTRKSAISKPVLMFTKDSNDNMRALRAAAGLEDRGYTSSAVDSLDATPGGGISFGLSSGLGSSPTSTTGHSNETGKVSIPRQRADFGPVRSGAHQRARSASHARSSSTPKGSHARRRSTDTQGTRSSGDRDRDDELAEAVIVTASRATSLRSARSSAYSYAPSAYIRDSHPGGVAQVTRPRLVPFTSARGVPVPVPTLTSIAGPAGPREQRRVSQVAALVSPEAATSSKAGAHDADTDAIMTDGLRYVRAFGDQNTDFEPARPPNLGRQSPAPIATRSNSKRSSHSFARQDGVSPTQTLSSYVYPSPSQSVESSVKRGSRGSRGSLMMSRILVRTGEAFAFKYPIALSVPPNPASSAERKLCVRPLYGGSNLPSFLAHAVSGATPSLSGAGSNRKRRMRYEVEFWGTPNTNDVGEVIVGIFTDDSTAECVGRLVVEVVPRGA
ncbi:AXL2 [Sanghuangporus sanghuang]